MSRFLLRMEGVAVLVAGVYIYFLLDFSWLLFMILLLAPDLSMVGYWYGTKIGAFLYNIFHSYILPIGLILVAIVVSFPDSLAIGLIWICHIGMDRAIGFGLKYPSNFKQTHLQRI